MKKVLKTLVMFILISSILVMSVACGTTDQTSQTTTTTSAGGSDETEVNETTDETTEPTTLEIYTWWDITKFEHLQRMEKAFEDANPDILLEFVTLPDDYANQMLMRLAGGGKVPDVMMLAMDQVPRYAAAGKIQSLDALASSDYLDSLYPVVKNALTVDGTLFAAGRDVTSKVMYLNKAMFAEANIDIPDPDWTKEEFLEIAQQLTKGSGVDAQWGHYWMKYGDQTLSWIAAHGGNYYSEDGKSSVLSKGGSFDGLTFMYDLYNTYKVCPSDAQAKQFGDGEFAAFIANKVAMQIGGLSISSALAADNVDYAVLPIPTVNGKSTSTSFVNSWVIPEGVENPDLSWRVVEFLSGQEGQQIALDSRFGLPASSLVDTADFVAEREDNQHFIYALENSIPFPVHANGTPFLTMMMKELEQIWAGTSTPDQVAATIDENSIEILAE